MPSDVTLSETASRAKARRARFRRRSQTKELSAEELQELQQKTRSTVRQAMASMILASLILLVFNSDGLRSYARDLPPSRLSDQLVLAADNWHQLMQSIGATRPKELVRQLVAELREA